MPEDRVDELMARADGAMTIDVGTDFVCEGLPASLTEAVNEKLPLLVGVPEITPSDAFSVSPAGRLPDEIDQV